MSKARFRNYHSSGGNDRPAASELVEQIDQFDGSGEQFLMNLLAVQCFLSRADGAAVLRESSDGGIDVLAVYPDSQESRTPPAWVKQSAKFARQVISSNAAIATPWRDKDSARGQTGRRHILLVPLRTADIGEAVAAFVVTGRDGDALEATRQRLELTSRLLGVSEKRLTIYRRQEDLTRLQSAMEVLSAINMHNRFTSTAMALCNEVASHWQAERVSIGFLKGRYVRLKAMSHTEDFGRKMRVVQDIESAMEECLDQDCEILHPASKDSTYISRATDDLSKQHGPLSILSLPLRQGGEARAVLTLERSADDPFSLEQVETIRLTCDLCTARLMNLYEQDRWFGARLAAKLCNAGAALVGPRHTWAKMATVLCFAAILFLVFAKGQFRVEAPFALEATYLQVVPAPFDGYLKSVEVEVGDVAEADKTILAELDTAELRLQLAAAKADEGGYLKQVSTAMRDGDTAQAQIAQANADKVTAQIDLLNYMIDRASLISPISGTVVKGDLKRQIGAPVKTGDVLFEVAPVEALRAELLVPENEIHDIKVDQQGYLATASYPERRVKFIVERVNPASDVVTQRNVFRVRVRLAKTHPWMRPGMEGVAKVSIGRRRYAWIWSRRVVNWIRMKLWI